MGVNCMNCVEMRSTKAVVKIVGDPQWNMYRVMLLPFGKYKDHTVEKIAKEDSRYLEWLSGGSWGDSERVRWQWIPNHHPEIVEAAQYYMAYNSSNENGHACIPAHHTTRKRKVSAFFNKANLQQVVQQGVAKERQSQNAVDAAKKNVASNSNMVSGKGVQKVPFVLNDMGYFGKKDDDNDSKCSEMETESNMDCEMEEAGTPVLHKVVPVAKKKGQDSKTTTKVEGLFRECLEIARTVVDILGPSHSEATYEQAMLNALYDRRIACRRQVQYSQRVNKHSVNTGILDLEVDHCLLLELKAGHEQIREEHKAQLMRYLRCKRENIGADTDLIAAVILFSKSGEVLFWRP